MNQNKKYYAITINNKKLTDNLSSINKVYNYLNELNIKTIIISVERNQLNENEHYHILSYNVPQYILDNVKIVGFWIKELELDIEVLKYYEYVKKDGRFKQYEVLNIESEQTNIYKIAITKFSEGMELREFFLLFPESAKNIYQIKELFSIYYKGKEVRK